MSPLSLFEGFGVELEYAIVDADTLDVRPIADRFLADGEGAPESEVERGSVAWSNELVLHVMELKTNGPAPALAGVAAAFQKAIGDAEAALAPEGARLMPGGMHPWMDPSRETRLWPHEYHEVYLLYDRIFDCARHGWANVQSAHLNLSFDGDDEFARLHAAIRVALPLLPALAASSPIADGRAGGALDTRLEHYRDNARRVPSMTGDVVPECVDSHAEYEARILAPLYAELAPLDPEGVLRHEWANARGCIARFDRSAIEIRLLDMQECPAADLAVSAAVFALVRELALRRGAAAEALQRFDTARLVSILEDTVRDGDDARIRDPEYLALLEAPEREARAGDLWRRSIDRTLARDPGRAEFEPALGVVLEEGCLARRIVRALDGNLRRDRLHEVYGALADCLRDGRSFRAA